jgi:hypothetical protein
MRYRNAIFVVALSACVAGAQTLVDLRTQSKSVDFSAATATKPFKSGTALPATCGIGEAFFLSNAPPGSNWYACTATNSWTIQSGAPFLAGDVTGASTATVVAGIQGRAVSLTAPTGGQSLVWNSGTNAWTPQTASSALAIEVGGTAQGTEAALNFNNGAGIIQSCTNNTGSSRVDCTPIADMSVMLSRAVDQAATDIQCIPASGSGTAYTCAVTPALQAQAANSSRWIFTPDVTCAANPTLNINGQGALSLRKLSAGALTNLAANDCVAGVPYQMTKAASGFVVDTMTLAGGSGTGTVTSVGLTMPGEFSVANSPVTSSGTLVVSKANQNANVIYAGPTSGLAAAPVFRSLVGADLPNGTSGSGSVVLSTAPTLTNPSLGTTSAITSAVVNAATTGTTANLLAKLTGAPSSAVTTATTDTSGVIGIVVSGAGTSGSSQIAREGTAQCVFDGATTAGDYVQISSTVAGDCHDAGSSLPTGGQVLGRVLSTNAATGTFAMAIQAISQGAGSGGGGALTLEVGGTSIGTQSTLNFNAGAGITQTCVNNSGNNRVDCTPTYNSSLIPTHDTIHANESYCSSSNETISYTCSLPNKALTADAVGMVFLLNVDTTCAAACTVNIDGNGLVNIKKIDGATDPGGTLIATQPQFIFYDGSVFRLL